MYAGAGTAPVLEQRSGTVPPDHAGRYEAWHAKNEFRAFGSADAANLAWWESYLLQSYLAMYEATEDTFWLNRLCAHADTALALLRDAPESGDFWPGYLDGYLGWGTTRYDPEGRYQEYLVHDGQMCLPLARFCRLVARDVRLAGFAARAARYRSTIEDNVVAKWYANWGAQRGFSEHLAGFGGWARVPFNQSLVFGELLLVLGSIGGSSRPGPVPATFYSTLPDSMAQLLRQSLAPMPEHDAYVWSHWPGADRPMRWEDISHANLVISFALEASQCSAGGFTERDFARLGRTLTRVMWDGSDEDPGFTRFVNGTGGYGDYSTLQSWLALGAYERDVHRLIRQAYLAHPEWTDPSSTSSCRALVLARLAALENGNRKPASIMDASADEGTGFPLLCADGAASRGRAAPNPFCSHTTLTFACQLHRPTALTVFDAAGRAVRSLRASGAKSRFRWDGTDDRGRTVRPGTYFIVGCCSALRVVRTARE